MHPTICYHLAQARGANLHHDARRAAWARAGRRLGPQHREQSRSELRGLSRGVLRVLGRVCILTKGRLTLAAVRAAAAEPMTQGASPLPRLASLASVRARAGLRAVRLSPPQLRTANGHYRDERRASWIELFFDLVFAGAVGQLAGAFQDHPALGGLARFAMLFTPIWWLWVMFTFYADRHESEDTAHHAAFLSAMLLCVALAASVRRARWLAKPRASSSPSAACAGCSWPCMPAPGTICQLQGPCTAAIWCSSAAAGSCGWPRSR
jgi:hypothetical protein